MNIHIKTTNLTLTPDMKDYLDKKMGAFDNLIDPNDTSVSCQVELAKTTNHHKAGDIFKTEINLRKDGKQFRAVSEQETLMASMDEAKDEILAEFKSYRSKQMTMMRRGGAALKNMIKGIGNFGGSVGGSIGNIGSSIGNQFKRFRRRG